MRISSAQQRGSEGMTKDEIKKILEKQLQLLSEESESASTEDMCKLSEQIRAIALILLQQNQSFYEASTNHPYAVQLPVEDLVDLYAARAQLLRHQGPSRKT